MHKKIMLSASVGALLVVSLAACSSSSKASSASSAAGGSSSSASSASSADSAAASAAGSSTATTPDKSLKIDYASPVMAQPGQQQFVQGLKAAAALSKSSIEALDSNVKAAQQVSNMQTMLEQKPDVIGTWTLDPGSTAGIYSQIQAANIPLIGTNSNDSGIKYSVYQADSVCTTGGVWDQTAAMYAKIYPGGSIITIGLDGVPSIDANVQCFTAAAKKDGLKVIAHVSNTTDDSAGGQKLTADELTKYPSVNGIWAYNDASALGASAAVLAAGKKVSSGTADGIVVTGANGDADAIQAVSQGNLTATWDPNNVEFGWLFMKYAEQVIAGTAAKQVTLDSTLITKANASTWVAPAKRTISFDTLKYTSSS